MHNLDDRIGKKETEDAKKNFFSKKIIGRKNCLKQANDGCRSNKNKKRHARQDIAALEVSPHNKKQQNQRRRNS